MAGNGGESPSVVKGHRAGTGRGRHRAPRYLADNLPYIATGLLGAWVCLHVHWALAVVELLATLLGPLWIITRVCPHCLLYGRGTCPSGYGLVSAALVDRGDPDRFGEAFSLHITAVMPMWFIPLAGVGYLLLTGGQVPWLLLMVFVGVAFVLVPLKARYVTCARCAKRADCPWGSRAALPRSRTSRGR